MRVCTADFEFYLIFPYTHYVKKTKKRVSIIDPKERLELFIENTKEYAIIILDPKGLVDDWNKGAELLLGYREEDVIGRDFTKFFTKEDKKAKRPQKELELAVNVGRGEDENWLVRKDGTQFWASGVTTPILDKIGNLIGFSKIIRDLTDRKEIEQQKDDVLAIVSHEVKTPLTTTKLVRGMLRKHLEKKDDKEGIKFFDAVSKSIEQLEHVLLDLLDVAKLKSGTGNYEKKEFEIAKLVKNVCSELQQTTSKHTIEVTTNTNKKVLASKSQIQEVITNLLTNAIKYSPKGEKIFVMVDDDGKDVVVSVQDFGIGISKENQKKIFQRFYRTNLTHEKKILGTGLGLYIAKKIIDNHKGRLSIQSVPRKGTTLFFTLPSI